MEKQCPICGKYFTTVRKTTYTCSSECSALYKKQKNAEYQKTYYQRRKAGLTSVIRKHCEICGSVFTDGCYSFCSRECYEISKINIKVVMKDTVSGAGQTHDNKNIDLISDAASKCGMTYGQYQAQKYLKSMERIKV